VSDDGKSVYLGFSAGKTQGVNWYSRDDNPLSLTYGRLTFQLTYRDGANGGNSLAAANSTEVSPGSANVYATSSIDNALTTFTRQAAGSLITPVAAVDNAGGIDGLGGATNVVLSADGTSVYVAGTAEDKIAMFARNTGSGALTFLGVQANLAGPVLGLDGITGLAVSPDGAWVYGAATVDGALSLFGRNAATGVLSFVTRVTGLAGARSVVANAVSGSDKPCAYVATSSAVATYCLGAEDFGDAPDTSIAAGYHYPTTAANAGARNTADATLFLGGAAFGTSVDTEADGVPSAGADGDDLAGADDEDGITARDPGDTTDVPLSPTAMEISGGAAYSI
jgi:hypothetical protein